MFAERYFNFGFNVTCITNYTTDYNYDKSNILKSPNHAWFHLEENEQTYEEFNSYDWVNAIGVGVVLGYENLYAIDIDGCTDENFIYEILNLLKIDKNYEWVIKSGSSNGFHIIFYVNKNLPNGFLNSSKPAGASSFNDGIPSINAITYNENNYKYTKVTAYMAKSNYRHIFDRIEFRQNDHLVLPPSLHKSTFKYKFLNNRFPENPPETIDDDKLLNDIIDEFVELKKGEILPSGATWLEMGFYYCHTITNSHSLTSNDILRLAKKPIYLVVDIETNGLPVDINKSFKNVDNWPDIIQIAWLLIDSTGKIYKKNSDIVRLEIGHPIDFVNIDFDNIHKVSNSLRYILELFIDDVKIATHIVAHNTDFDLNVIQSRIIKCGLFNPIPSKTSICTMRSSVDYCGIKNSFGYKYPSLSELYYKLFNTAIINGHNAETDVLATAKCLIKLQDLKLLFS